jgi:hypothetical protein
MALLISIAFPLMGGANKGKKKKCLKPGQRATAPFFISLTSWCLTNCKSTKEVPHYSPLALKGIFLCHRGKIFSI